MVINSTIKDLYSLALKYKEDMTKYSDINPYTITMDLFRNIIYDLAANVQVSWPSSSPIYTAQQQIYYTLELAPPKALDWIEVDFVIEKNRK